MPTVNRSKGRPHPSSRASSIASVDRNNTGSQSAAALFGATQAFIRAAPPHQNARIPPAARSHGATGAAVTAGSGTASRSHDNPPLSRNPRPAPLPRDSSVGPGVVKETIPMNTADPASLAPANNARPQYNRSPSHQAAVLATSRAQPSPPASSERPVPLRAGSSLNKPPIAPKPRRLSGNRRTMPDNDKPTDTTPVAPTTSLVDLYERKMKETQEPPKAGKRPDPIVIKPTTDLTIRSPKPIRSGITSMIQLELGQDEKQKDTAEQGQVVVDKLQSVESTRNDRPSSDASFASAAEALSPRSPQSTQPPQAVPSRSERPSSFSSSHNLKIETDAKRRPQASPSPLRHPNTMPIDIKTARRSSPAQSDTYSVSSPSSVYSLPAQMKQAYPKRMTPLTTGDELANALVASSLASSRGPSPRRFDPPAAPYRKKNQTLHHTLSPHHLHQSLSPHHHRPSFSRTPSPKKGAMLQTLRKQDDSSSDEDEEWHPYAKHKKKRHIRKHPNKHHEGDRKRWRDAVTDRERRRYEGVWAANKGLHYSFTYDEIHFFKKAPDHPTTLEAISAVQDQVSGLMAREIWLRSRLTPDVLESVWDLVDSNNVGRLCKEEFVVGMWLIDQRLKGRKLPVKVSETVWASVRGLHGIKIRKK